jgi:hypothetical protein
VLGRPIIDDIGVLERIPYILSYWPSWGVNESIAYRTIRKIEDILVKSRVFTLPGKKKLFNCDCQLQVVIVDVTESPIERPKKNRRSSTVGRRNSIHSSHK